MLVKFLSYIVSVIGARRYKPIFISLAVLTLTVTGITMVASALSNGSYDASSFEQSKAESEPANKSSSSDLKGLSRQQAKDESQQSIAKTEVTTSNDTPKPAQTSERQPQSSPTPDFTISNNTVTMQPNGSHAITATAANGGTSLTWTVNADNIPSGLSTVIDQKDQPSSAIIRLKAESATPGMYQLIVTLKDNTTGLSAQKTLQLTIVQ